MKPRHPYSTYKRSGVEWIGQVPIHWQACRTKFVARLYSGHTPSRDKPEYWVSEECTIPWFTLADVWQLRDGTRTYLGDTSEKISPLGLANSAARLLPAGTVIVSRTASVGFAGIMPRPMATTQDFVNWVCGERIRPRFLLHVFRAMRAEFSRLTMGSTHQTIYMPEVRSFSTPLPPVEEQEAIIAFLERETARIDALIAKKRWLIELLREKRQAVISHAVTKGLDPHAPMKHSGMDWLGEIPAHWEVRRLKFIAHLQTGIALGKIVSGETRVVPYLRVANVQDGYIDLDHVAEIEVNSDEVCRYSLRKGDVLMNEGGDFDKLGRGAVWRGDISPCLHQNHVFAVRPRHVDPDWLATITTTSYAKWFFVLRSKQTTNSASISSTNLSELPVIVPPSDERSAILRSVTLQTGSADRAIGLIRMGIERLEEHRSSLIAAAVTGKIDVRGGAAEAVEAAD